MAPPPPTRAPPKGGTSAPQAPPPALPGAPRLLRGLGLGGRRRGSRERRHVTAAPVERRRRWRRQRRGGAAAGGERGGTGLPGLPPPSRASAPGRPPDGWRVSAGGGRSVSVFIYLFIIIYWLKSRFWSVTRGSCVCWGWGSGCRLAPGRCCKGEPGGARSRLGQEAAAGSGRRELAAAAGTALLWHQSAGD